MTSKKGGNWVISVNVRVMFSGCLRENSIFVFIKQVEAQTRFRYTVNVKVGIWYQTTLVAYNKDFERWVLCMGKNGYKYRLVTIISYVACVGVKTVMW